MSQRIQINLCDRHVGVQAHGNQSAATRQLEDAGLRVPPDALVAAIVSAAEELGIRRGRAKLVLSSAWCYAQRVSVPQRRPSRAMLAYALEDQLPVDIETLSCDFVRRSASDYLGIAVETHRLRPVLAGLVLGIVVDRITVDVFDAAEGIDGHNPLLWCDADHAALLSRAGGEIDMRICRLSPGHSDDACRARIGDFVRAITDGPAVRVIGCVEADWLARLAEDLGATTAIASKSTGATPWRRFDLARDQLAPAHGRIELVRTGRRAAAVALAAMLLLCVGLVVRQSMLRHELQRIEEWERQMFVQLLPGQPPPAGVALRLASERRRLEALTGSGPSEPVVRPDALETLRQLVAALPPDLTLDLQELRIEAGDVLARGLTRDHPAAERLAAAIDALKELRCSTPRTERARERGVQFFVHAQRAEPTPGIAGKNR